MQNIVVYSAICGGYDYIKPPLALWKEEAEFIIFLDEPQSEDGWTVRPAYRRFKDPCRNAKIHKILPHKYFPDADYSLWIDGSVLINSTMPLSCLIDECLDKNDLAVFKHRSKKCIYQEGRTCLRLGLDSPGVIYRQMQKYFDSGYPANNGLAECTVILRRHTKSVRRFNEAWYQEIVNGSRRDQLSFNYVANKLNFKFAYLPGSIKENPHFLWLKHIVQR